MPPCPPAETRTGPPTARRATSCAARIEQLQDVDIRGDGLDALRSQFNEVQTDARAFAYAARSDFGREAEALSSSASGLGSAVEDVGTAPSAGSISTLGTGVSEVAAAFEELSRAVSSEC